ncbi:NHL domain-containing thioredoxin family protein [Amycolatopsis acidiphila]|uniref:Redoxin domain-containing protein n=1 Tax=Amycolatopsis acidiphila TaxID=715473 RepID=A0A558A6S5_9PSEU|nr:NHL domain-containing thioredoxin family protein [Amycolatopsis acidiphila]TVT19973.1 redoxin domain-containing protein [Amycolatopsis acidiphila]UIJ64139.1 NHL domain-containing thioredoxin family protein [Amycolatopsis acidiphila]
MRAPELSGDVWLNTGGKQVRLAELRGKIVLLDFWTSGCINCLHVLDELRPLEEEFADVLVTIGVHSPKFLHEGEAAAIEAAVRRYAVHHPVLNDPDMRTWSQYAVKAWPTLVLVDPAGYVVHVAAGEGHAEGLRRVIGELVAEHEAKGTLRRGGSLYVPAEEQQAELAFPSKAVATAEGRILVADTAHHSVVEFASDGETVVRRFGSGGRGAADGAFDIATFAEPSGLTLLPAAVAEQVGYHLLVADTAGHLLRGINLINGEVSTVAGTGNQWRNGETDGPAREIDLTSPWDVAWWEPAGGVVVAMAGNHTLDLFDPVKGTISRYAGTTVEGLRDGALAEAFFAQTSGLAVQGNRLWLADAETSALRWIEDGEVHTAVGTDLFSFGHRDGDADDALLQHPLGVAALPDGTIAVADTYNGAIRRYDPESREVATLANGLAEPSGLLVTEDALLVVESAAHQLRTLSLSADGTQHAGDAHAVRRPPSVLAPGEVELSVVFTPPPGEKLDDRFGPSTRLEVSASPPELLVDGGGTGTELTRRITLAEGHREGVLQVVAQAASCDSDAEHPVCRVTRQDWGVPIRFEDGGPGSLQLILAGTA